MKRLILIFAIFLLTSCGGSKLPDPDMAFPESGPDIEVMEPTTSPE